MQLDEYLKERRRTSTGPPKKRLINSLLGMTGEIEELKDARLAQMVLHQVDKAYENSRALEGAQAQIGALAEVIKKQLFQGHELPRDLIVKEAGDLLWYYVEFLESVNIPLEEVMAANIEKLRKRYPEGFSEEASTNREE